MLAEQPAIPTVHDPFVALRRLALVLPILMVASCGSPEQKAQSYYERGVKLLSQHDYVKAGLEFKNALQLRQDMVGPWRGLLEIEQHNNNIPNVVQILRKIVELDPKDDEAKIKLGNYLLGGKAVDQTIDLANAVLEHNSRQAAALALRAAAYVKLNDGVAARRDAQAALEIDPKNTSALIVLAAERMSAGDTQGALRILDRQEVSGNDELAIELFKLQLFEQSKDLTQVEALLRKLAERYPQQITYQQALIRFYITQKRLDEAEKSFRALAAANPTDVKTQLDLIRFLRTVKGPIPARQELVHRIDAGGDVFAYQLALAEFDSSQGNVAESVKSLEKLAASKLPPAQAIAVQIKLAQIQLGANNLAAADASVAEVLGKDSRNADALRIRAAIHMQRGELEPAISDLREVLNDQPRATLAMLDLATAYERSGSIELAEKQLADAVQASGFDPGVGLNYVAFLRRRGNPERAEEILTELDNRRPNNITILSTLADVRLARQNWSGAQAIAEKIRQLGDDHGRSDQIAGLALMGRSQNDEAIRTLENAYQAAGPAAEQPLAALVNAMVRAGKTDRAMTFLKNVLASNPANAEAHVLVGSLQLANKSPEQAVKSFHTAIEKQPKYITGYLMLAEFYAQGKKFDEAEKTIRAGLAEQPDNFAAHLALAGLLERKGDFEGAIEEYTVMLQKQPGSLVIANNLAGLLVDRRSDQASLDRAFSLAAMLRKSQVPAFKDTLGWIYFRRGDHKSAAPLLEEAAVALPKLAVVRYHLGMLYVADDQRSKALEQFKKALELNPDSDLQSKILTAQQRASL